MCYADLKAKRLKYHISQSKLAVASGYTKAAISSWERNKVIPSPYDLEKLNAILTQLIDAINAGTLNIQKKSIRPSPFVTLLIRAARTSFLIFWLLFCSTGAKSSSKYKQSL